MRLAVDMNSDMGEGFGPWRMGDDALVMDFITSANIACGFHAGDPLVMKRTVSLAVGRGVAIGAHPGYPDLSGFGRREMDCSPEEIHAFCLYQIGALAAVAGAAGAGVAHVKAHGALYNRGAKDAAAAAAITGAVRDAGKGLVLVGPPDSAFERAAGLAGVPFAAEAFADRAYMSDGSLVPRSKPGAVIADPEEAARRAVSMVVDGRVTSIDGAVLKIRPDTICIHGDTPGAAAMARRIRSALEKGGVFVGPLSSSR
ncbi:MAG: 5-oxoprolinase subunit PxpA [Thermovirgaceae bacterium]|nr:5-oxoprolinase subunit PxpA [Thermovirgaceae bacterium]